MRSAKIFGLTAAVALVASCDREAAPTAAERQPTAASEEAAVPEAEVEPEAEAESATPPGYDQPADDVLGTVPEGYGLAERGRIPDVTLESFEGEPTELRNLVEAGPVLVNFYRGGWCPYCSTQIRELATGYEEFERRGVQPIFISVDQVGEAAKAQQAYEIPFPVLSDPDLKAHEAFRVIVEVSEEQVERLRGHGMDIEAASGRDHHKLAMPSHFLFDAGGELVWQHLDPDYRVRPRMAQLLEVLDAHDLSAEN